MPYTTLHRQMVSRTEGLSDPSLAQRLGYESPLTAPWTPGNVGSQILQARGNSYGSKAHHPADPTKFQLAAYTLVDAEPTPVGTVSEYGNIAYGTHNSKVVMPSFTAGSGDVVTPYGYERTELSSLYDLPAGFRGHILGDDFAFSGEALYPIGSKSLSELVSLDEIPNSRFSEVLKNGSSTRKGGFQYVCTLHNVSGTESAIYFLDQGTLWCYTTQDCTFGVVRLPDGAPYSFGTFGTAPEELLYARGILDDDRFLRGQFALILAATGYSMRADLDGFRQIVSKSGISLYQHRSAIIYNDYHLTRVRASKSTEFSGIDLTGVEGQVSIPGVKSIDFTLGAGPVDLTPQPTLQDFAESCAVVGLGWMRNGWASAWLLDNGWRRPYKYM